MKDTKEYALYKGEELLASGTVKETAEQMGVKVRTIQFYKTPTYRKRHKYNFRELVVIE